MSTSQTPSWKTKLPGCFGIVDLIFAMHPADEARAKAMMKEAFDSGASIDDVFGAVRDYLASRNATPQHIEKQLEYVRKLKFGA